MLDDGLAARGPEYQHEIETTGNREQPAVGKEPAGGALHPKPLLPRDGFIQRLMLFGGSCLDFHEDDVVAVERDQVDFAGRAMEIPGQDAMPALGEIPPGTALATTPEAQMWRTTPKPQPIQARESCSY